MEQSELDKLFSYIKTRVKKHSKAWTRNEFNNFQKELEDKILSLSESEGYEEEIKTKILNYIDKLIAKYDETFKYRKTDKEKFVNGMRQLYKYFFYLQNLINIYVNKSVIFLTKVKTGHNKDTNALEKYIYLSFNDTKALTSTLNKQWSKIKYKENIENISRKMNWNTDVPKGLNETTEEVERRFDIQNKHMVLWETKISNNIHYYRGYKFKAENKGPINEAYVNFYFNNIRFTAISKEQNVCDFIIKGAINADGANGFLIGDVELGNVKFAVKGDDAFAQGMIAVIKVLQDIKGDMKDHTADDYIDALENKFAKMELQSQLEEVISDNFQKLSEDYLNKVFGNNSNNIIREYYKK